MIIVMTKKNLTLLAVTVVQYEASNQHKTHSDLIVAPAEGAGSGGKQLTEGHTYFSGS